MPMIFEPNDKMPKMFDLNDKIVIKLIPITVEGVVSYTADRTGGIHKPPPPLGRLRRLIKRIRRWM